MTHAILCASALIVMLSYACSAPNPPPADAMFGSGEGSDGGMDQGIDSPVWDGPPPVCLGDVPPTGPLPDAGTTIRQVSAGDQHTCALMGDGTIRCWGDNSAGQLGDATTVRRLRPTAVQGITNAVAISAGGEHTCALLADGSVQCWGANESGELGDGTTMGHLTPVAAQVTNATQLTSGAQHTCALLQGGGIACWGRNTEGELGIGTVVNSAVPSMLTITNATMVAAGAIHTCAALSDGTADCWGSNSEGEGGNCMTTSPEPAPTMVRTLTSTSEIEVGFIHSCARDSSGGVTCWGNGDHGQLSFIPPAHGACQDPMGFGNSFYSPLPIALPAPATQLALGEENSCALLGDGTVHCWGANLDGQSGVCVVGDIYTPVAVAGLSGASQIAAGALHACALLGQDAVMCWGDNEDGRLGDGTESSRWWPAPVVW